MKIAFGIALIVLASLIVVALWNVIDRMEKKKSHLKKKTRRFSNILDGKFCFSWQ